jgi:hypothetical protein
LDNIVKFPRREVDHVVLEFEIGLGSVDEARRTLECIEATVAVGLNLVNKTDTADEGVILAGLERLFEALATLIARERDIVPGCVLPRFDRDHPPDGAA